MDSRMSTSIRSSKRSTHEPNYFTVFTADASKHACRAVLTQEYDGRHLPVVYALKAFTKGKNNKSAIEQELTAIH